MIDFTMKEDFFNNRTSDFYKNMILGPLSIVYSGINKDKLNEIDKFATLLMDKFAIHSTSFFHLSNGLFETKMLDGNYKMFAYDLFSINAIFRSIMETYATFNNLFIEPETFAEKQFRYSLWRLDGLNEKLKFNVKPTDFEQAQTILENDKIKYERSIAEFEQLEFYKNLSTKEISKIFCIEKRRFNWRFLFKEKIIKPLNITSLIEYTCPTRGLINTYRFTSTHAHSTFLAIEHFEKYRGKELSEEYVNPQLKLAIFITCMMISDMCLFDQNAKSEFDKLNKGIQDFIIGTTSCIKQKNANS